MTIFNFSTLGVPCLVLLSSCYYDKEQPYPEGNSNCDATDMISSKGPSSRFFKVTAIVSINLPWHLAALRGVFQLK